MIEHMFSACNCRVDGHLVSVAVVSRVVGEILASPGGFTSHQFGLVLGLCASQ